MIVQHAATTNIGGPTNMVGFVKVFSDGKSKKHMGHIKFYLSRKQSVRLK